MAIGKLPDADVEGGEEGMFTEINIVPLTDIFLVMLIIFMVAAAGALDRVEEVTREKDRVVEDVASSQRSGLKVNLPSGATQDIDPTASSLLVTITTSGDILIEDQTLTPEALENAFRSAFARNKDTQIIIRADQGVNHGRVVSVMERAKRVGLTRLAIATAGGT
jgi:biopolymer transport protein TolR